MMTVKLGTQIVQERESLTVFPLVGEEQGPLPHRLLAEVLAAGTLEVRELGEGQVPIIVVENHSADPVLILDGEQLIGAKQSRMVNRSVIVPGDSKTEIPVSCIEQGRWHFTSREFKSGSHYSPGKVRRKARDLEKRRARRGQPVHSSSLGGSQGAVWEECRSISESLKFRSPTDSLDDVSQSVDEEMRTWVASFPLVKHQVGVLAFLNGRPLALDMIGGHELYCRIHGRLMHGYIMDALSSRRPGRAPNETNIAQETADEFLGAVSEAVVQEAPTTGVGSYYVLRNHRNRRGGITGGRLEQEVDGENRVIHLSAFPEHYNSDRQTERDLGESTPLRRPSRRRWGYR